MRDGRVAVGGRVVNDQDLVGNSNLPTGGANDIQRSGNIFHFIVAGDEERDERGGHRKGSGRKPEMGNLKSESEEWKGKVGRKAFRG